jgi:hypothetical protein
MPELPSATTADVFAALSSADLARVLNSAGNLSRVDLEKLDRATWKILERAKRLKRPPPEELLRRMAEAIGRDEVLAYCIWRDWWGRRLEGLLLDAALRELVRGWRLQHRLVLAAEAFKRGDPGFVSFFDGTVSSLGASEVVLDRAFAALADGYAAGDDYANVTRRLAHAVRGVGGVVAAEEVRAPSTAAIAAPANIPRAEIALVGPDTEATSEDPPRTALLHVPPSPTADAAAALASLAASLQQCVSIGTELMAAAQRGQFADAAALAERATRHKVDSVSQRAALVDQLGTDLAPITEEALTNGAAAERYVAHLRAQIDEIRILAQARVDEMREALGQQFAEVDLAPPPDLGTARSAEELKALRGTWAERLQAEGAYRAVVRRDPEAPRMLGALAPGQRLSCYGRLADEPDRPLSPEEVLTLWVGDPVATSADGPPVTELFARLAALVLEEERALPPNAWELAAVIAREDVAHMLLANERLLDALRLVDDSLWQPLQLLAKLGPGRAALPVDLRHTLDRVAVRSLPPRERVAAYAQLSIEDRTDRDALTALLEALIVVERDREALLLALAAYRTGAVEPLPAMLFESILVTVVATAIDEPEWRPTLAELVGDGDWMTESIEGVTVLMFLSHLLGLPHAYDHLRYARPEQLERATAIRPVLVGRWLSARLAGHQVGAADQADLLDRARQALEKWDHEIAKGSAYSGWVPAEDYQPTLFTPRLERCAQVCPQVCS